MAADLAWNYASLGVLAIGGIVINLVIAGGYGAAALGVFNQTYAIYVVASQLAVGGIHHSTLKHVAEHGGAGGGYGGIARAGLVLAALTGAVSAAIIALASAPLGQLLDSEQVATAILYIAPGLFLFALNKVNLAVLNGLRYMKMYAACQTLRFVAMVGFVVGAASYDAPVPVLSATFTFAEFLLALFLTPYVVLLDRKDGGGLSGWIRTHAGFGIRSALSGLLMETNVRVDVLMLGIFAGDALVGIYSLAAIVAEGFYNLLVVVRNNVNPVLVGWLRDRRYHEMTAFMRRTRRYIYPLAALAGAALIAAYPMALPFISIDAAFRDGWVPLIILIGGIVLYSGTLPFDGILLQMGRPETHTLFVAAVAATNIALNAGLIPLLGMNGAALATAASMLLGRVYIDFLLKRHLGFGLRGGGTGFQ